MKILFDNDGGENIERHAKMLHRAMMNEKKLPRLAAATRAMVPGYCDDCGDHAWTPIMGGISYCHECQEKRSKQNALGFGS